MAWYPQVRECCGLGQGVLRRYRRSLPGPAPAVPLQPVTPADLLLINDCINQNPGSETKNMENPILLQP